MTPARSVTDLVTMHAGVSPGQSLDPIAEYRDAGRSASSAMASLASPAASPWLTMQDPAPYYFLRAKGSRGQTDVICARVAPLICSLAEKLTGRQHQMVFAGIFSPSDLAPNIPMRE